LGARQRVSSSGLAAGVARWWWSWRQLMRRSLRQGERGCPRALCPPRQHREACTPAWHHEGCMTPHDTTDMGPTGAAAVGAAAAAGHSRAAPVKGHPCGQLALELPLKSHRQGHQRRGRPLVACSTCAVARAATSTGTVARVWQQQGGDPARPPAALTSSPHQQTASRQLVMQPTHVVCGWVCGRGVSPAWPRPCAVGSHAASWMRVRARGGMRGPPDGWHMPCA
jgi:hypothetical protein